MSTLKLEVTLLAPMNGTLQNAKVGEATLNGPNGEKIPVIVGIYRRDRIIEKAGKEYRDKNGNWNKTRSALVAKIGQVFGRRFGETFKLSDGKLVTLVSQVAEPDDSIVPDNESPKADW